MPKIPLPSQFKLEILLWKAYFYTRNVSIDDTHDEKDGGSVATVTKSELAGILARDLGMTRVQARKAVDALFNGLRDALQQGGRIEIRGFGAWTVKATNSKPNARNPRTGEVVAVPARRKVAFKPGQIIREALSQPIEDRIPR